MRFPRVGRRTKRLTAFVAAMFGVVLSYGVLGACLINFDKIKVVLMAYCSIQYNPEVTIPMLNWTLSVALAHNLTMMMAAAAALTGAMSCIAIGYLFGSLSSDK